MPRPSVDVKLWMSVGRLFAHVYVLYDYSMTKCAIPCQ